MECKICSNPSLPTFSAKMLGKYEAAYYRCTACGFMQTDQPHWLGESYASAINDIDIGPVNRAIAGAALIEGVILSSFDNRAKFIDFGAGYGVLVRLMRDRGFDFYWKDQYCSNLFAKHFVADEQTKYELLTAFEVFEHLVNPVDDIAGMLEYAPNLLFSTLIVPERIRAIEDWWYFGPDHGQHVAFYTIPALEVIAKRFGLHLATDGVANHLLSGKPVSSRMLRFFASDATAPKLVRKALRRRMGKSSLLMDDFRAVSGYKVG